MSNNANSSQKRGAGAGSTSDVDTVIPLLFAANPGIAPNYKKMSAMDSHGRTAVALEHKFRKWRAAAREILAAHPEEAGTDKVVGEPAKAKKPRVSKATNGHKKTVNDERAQKDDDDGPGETKTKTNGKKRGAPAKAEDQATPKKPRAPKKGTAQKVKEPAGSRGAGGASEEQSGEEDADEGKVKKEEDTGGDEEVDHEEGGVDMVFEAAD